MCSILKSKVYIVKWQFTSTKEFGNVILNTELAFTWGNTTAYKTINEWLLKLVLKHEASIDVLMTCYNDTAFNFLVLNICHGKFCTYFL